MAQTLRILIAEGHFLIREGLKHILSQKYPDIEFGEVENGPAALQRIWSEKWDLLLLDISMPGRGGLDTLKDVKRSNPELPVIILSMYPEDRLAIRAVKLGASAYISNDDADTDLLKGVEGALRGGRYITPSLAERLAQHLQEDRQGLPHQALSDREYQVLCQIAAGKTVKEVAAVLALSVKTISTYRSRILEKMGLDNNSHIMRYAVKNRLIDLDAAE